MGRPPIGETAMTAAERQRRRRAKLQPPFNAYREALALKIRFDDLGRDDDDWRAMIAAMIVEDEHGDFSRVIISEGYAEGDEPPYDWASTVTVTVTEEKMYRGKDGRTVGEAFSDWMKKRDGTVTDNVTERKIGDEPTVG